VSDELLERLLRPFLSGVFLESGLQTSRHFMDLVLRSFVRGTPSVPARGMGRIPHNLARSLPAEAVLTGTPVIEVSANQVRTSHGSIPAQGVIVATDPATAGRLLPGLAVPEGRAVTTWYHSVAGQTLTSGRSVLVLDGTGTGPLVNSVALSHAAPAYAPQGRTLVSSSALGVHPDDDSERAVRRHLARLYDTDTRDWQLLATYPIEYALPAMSVPLEPRKPVRLAPGIYVAGDHRDTASIQGALVSGRRAAQAAIVDREGPR
jgi:protoporphyrinogen oxidase